MTASDQGFTTKTCWLKVKPDHLIQMAMYTMASYQLILPPDWYNTQHVIQQLNLQLLTPFYATQLRWATCLKMLFLV